MPHVRGPSVAAPSFVDTPNCTELEAVVAARLAGGWAVAARTPTSATLTKRAVLGTQTVIVRSAAPPIRFSDDRLWWWDDRSGANGTWKGCGVELPPGVQRSPDGRLWWDGWTWRDVPAVGVDSL